MDSKFVKKDMKLWWHDGTMVWSVVTVENADVIFHTVCVLPVGWHFTQKAGTGNLYRTEIEAEEARYQDCSFAAKSAKNRLDKIRNTETPQGASDDGD